MYKIISWSAVIIWMLVIFNLSSQVADKSNQLSTGVTEIVVRTVEKAAPEVKIDKNSLNHIIRKNAHFFCYMVLGLLSMNAFRRGGNTMKKSLVLSFLLCVGYAISDEIHQIYVPGRGALATDVLIDCSGASIGLLIYWLAAYVFDAKRTKENISP